MSCFPVLLSSLINRHFTILCISVLHALWMHQAAPFATACQDILVVSAILVMRDIMVHPLNSDVRHVTAMET